MAEWDPSELESEIACMRQEYTKAEEGGADPSALLTFNYASLLICSPSKDDVKSGAEYLELCLEVGYRREECLHLLTLTHLKLGQYAKAKKDVDMWLVLPPKNKDMARLLHSVVLDRASHDGLLGLFLLGVTGLGLGFALLRRMR
mmetsp:Transcript_70923/g.122942  ORF Transcript_70923/g.122942 Transcript_70923/m.122942 type:complete len:145 (-) Transcript_70923:81-515(-)